MPGRDRDGHHERARAEAGEFSDGKHAGGYDFRRYNDSGGTDRTNCSLATAICLAALLVLAAMASRRARVGAG